MGAAISPKKYYILLTPISNRHTTCLSAILISNKAMFAGNFTNLAGGKA
jgi:hypothetical protein